MNRVMVLVEGNTERGICQKILAQDLYRKYCIDLQPRVVGEPGRKGGNDFPRVCKELCNLLKQEKNTMVTMLFDYYGLNNWPGLENARKASFDSKPKAMEDAIKMAVQKEFKNLDIGRFVPYVQMHEIESLLFADPAVMAKFFTKLNPAHKLAQLEDKFTQIVSKAGGCEQINNSYQTKPSKRIEDIVTSYKKGDRADAHAHQIINEIGLETIREKCPNFDRWLTTIERYAQEK